MIKNCITECIGNTPVIKVSNELIPPNKELFIKLEYFNPNFSIKDRTAFGLVKRAIEKNILQPGSTLIESTSGNLGKSLSMLGAIYNFRVIIVIDPKVSTTMVNWYKAYGAEVIMVDQPDENGGYQQARIKKVKELLQTIPGGYWPNQYDNLDNFYYHYEFTANEILEVSAESIIGAISTGGHFSGISRRINEINSDIKTIAVDVKGSAVFNQPFSPYKLNGVGLSWRSENTKPEEFDDVYIISDEHAISVCHYFSKKHGILLGGSGGLVVAAAIAELRNNNSTSALAIIPDTGTNYLDQYYDKTWLEENNITISDEKGLAMTLDNTTPLNKQLI